MGGRSHRGANCLVAQTIGVVFAKDNGETKTAVPFFTAGVTPSGGISHTCERFGVMETRVWKTDEDRDHERQMLVNLMSNYGNRGVLTRNAIVRVIEKHAARIQKIVGSSVEDTGYIKYSSYSCTYQAEAGPIVGANISSWNAFRPGGSMEFSLNVYSKDVGSVQFELRYADGTVLSGTEGEVLRQDLCSYFGREHKTVKVSLPDDLRAGEAEVVVTSLVDKNGRVMLEESKVVGEFVVEI